ncbi:amidohydrolase family protein, partial [Candidatus Poribacteria bacterium]|nr:amidohydrolase family protein [Candidatus Poribacteria bacterium]
KFLEWLHADEIVVYASDYPHWDWDNPKTVLPGISAELKRRIFVETARELYARRLQMADEAVEHEDTEIQEVAAD